MQELLPDFILQSFSPAPYIAVTSSVLGQAQELIVKAGLKDKQLCIVCDANTYEVLGKQIHTELPSSSVFLLEGIPYADEDTVSKVRAQPCDAWIAVGSGTISDLSKYASFLEDKPYAVFPTAPSMNGYLSANASITQNGHKQTFSAHLPSGVFCDLGVLAAAPQRLILSGLGDSLCRSTAQADWLLSHLLLGTTYSSEPFDWLEPYEKELYLHADRLISGDVSVIRLLTLILLVSGLGMVMAKGSYPASQGEHLIAHTMEMRHGSSLPVTYHGEQIGVTTLTMASIQQELLSRPLVIVARQPTLEKARIAEYFSEQIQTSIWQSYEPKLHMQQHIEELKHESEIRERIRSISLPPQYLESVLAKAGALRKAETLGWSNSDYHQAIAHARFIRNRYTFLDMLT